MAIPDFTEHGLLPRGVYPASRQDIAERYLGNPNRAVIWAGFEEFVDYLQAQTWCNCISQILIDGGFTSNKPHTKDIDVVINVASASDEQLSQIVLWHIDCHEHIASAYNVDVYPQHPKLKHNFQEFFSYVKADELTQRGAPIGTSKGMLELIT